MTDYQYCGKYTADSDLMAHFTCQRELEHRQNTNRCIKCKRKGEMRWPGWCGDCDEESPFKGYGMCIP